MPLGRQFQMDYVTGRRAEDAGGRSHVHGELRHPVRVVGERGPES
jgi:hypothetical protein